MSCCLGSTPFYFWKHLHIVRHIEFKNAFPKFRSRERKFEQPLARGLFWSRLFFILFAFETVWEVLLFQTVGRMIVPDKIFKDRTCPAFLAAWWRFRHAKPTATADREAQARILAIEFVSVCSFFLSFLFSFFSFQLLAFFLFTFTFIKLVKPVRHHANSVFKKYITIEKKNIFLMTWLVQTNKGGAKRRGKA